MRAEMRTAPSRESALRSLGLGVEICGVDLEDALCRVPATILKGEYPIYVREIVAVW